jgi:hypothetical protein
MLQEQLKKAFKLTGRWDASQTLRAEEILKLWRWRGSGGIRFLRNCLALEAALSGALKEQIRCVCRHYGWDEQEIDDGIENTATSEFLKVIRPNLTLAADKAKSFMVTMLLEEMEKLDKMNPSTWKVERYQAWCENCRKYSLEHEVCCDNSAKQPKVGICKHCSQVGHRIRMLD